MEILVDPWTYNCSSISIHVAKSLIFSSLHKRCQQAQLYDGNALKESWIRFLWKELNHCTPSNHKHPWPPVLTLLAIGSACRSLTRQSMVKQNTDVLLVQSGCGYVLQRFSSDYWEWLFIHWSELNFLKVLGSAYLMDNSPCLSLYGCAFTDLIHQQTEFVSST